MSEYAQESGGVTPEVYVQALIKQGKQKIRKTVVECFTHFFDILDLNDDGVISLEEFTIYYHIMGLDAKMAAETFAAIDTDGDGSLSRAEYMTAVDDFFVRENENSPYRFFWGPLVK